MKNLLLALTLVSMFASPAFAASEQRNDEGKPDNVMSGKMMDMHKLMDSMEEMMGTMHDETNPKQRDAMMDHHMQMMEQGMNMLDEMYLADQQKRRECSVNPRTFKSPIRLKCKRPEEPMDMHMEMMHMMMKHMMQRQKMMGI